MKSLLIVGF